MYRSRRRSLSSLLTFVLLGIAAGIVFLVYDGLRSRSVSLPAGTAPTAAPSSSPAPVIETTPTSPVLLAEGDTAGASLLIPAAGVYAPIVRVYLDGVSWDVSQLGMNVGHLQGTAWLDSAPGNIALSAHVEMADGRAGIFAKLDQLKVGDLVVLKRGDVERRYRVTAVKTVAPDDLSPLYPTTSERLTLITCGNYSFFQDTYLERVVVVAERVG